MPEHQVAQRTEEWFGLRRGRITASVAAACLGLHPYMSRQEAYRSILGESAKQANEFMKYGEDNEEAARSAYEAETGLWVRETGFWTHPAHDWLGASPDGLIGEKGMLEILCPREPARKVPVYKHIQILVQLLVTGRTWCDFYAWHPGASFCQRISLPRPGPCLGHLIGKLHAFHVNYVLAGLAPPRKKRGSR